MGVLLTAKEEDDEDDEDGGGWRPDKEREETRTPDEETKDQLRTPGQREQAYAGRTLAQAYFQRQSLHLS